MFKRIITKLKTFIGSTLCSQGFHKWQTLGGNASSRFCTRPGCFAAQQRSNGLWINFKRQEVSLEQVQKLNRHERRRLGSLTRKGAFGRIQE